MELNEISEGMKIDLGYWLDLLVEDAVIIELKAVTTVTPLHEAQLLSICHRLRNLNIVALCNYSKSY